MSDLQSSITGACFMEEPISTANDAYVVDTVSTSKRSDSA